MRVMIIKLLAAIFREARDVRREKWSATDCAGFLARTQTVGSKSLRGASEILGAPRLLLELVSKVSSAAVDDMRAATSSNFAKKSSAYLSGYASGFFARFPCLASHLANLATKLLLRPVLVRSFHRNAMLGLIILSLQFSLGGCSSVSPDSLALLGHPVPDGRLMLLSGEDVALKDSRGNNRAILFWATWCPHSSSIISQFEDLARTYATRGDTDFFAVSIDRNQDLDLLKGRIALQDLTTVTHVFSGNDVQDEAFLALKGDHVPYAVFVDGDSVVRYVGIGVGGLEDFLEQRFTESSVD